MTDIPSLPPKPLLKDSNGRWPVSTIGVPYRHREGTFNVTIDLSNFESSPIGILFEDVRESAKLFFANYSESLAMWEDELTRRHWINYFTLINIKSELENTIWNNANNVVELTRPERTEITSLLWKDKADVKLLKRSLASWDTFHGAVLFFDKEHGTIYSRYNDNKTTPPFISFIDEKQVEYLISYSEQDYLTNVIYYLDSWERRIADAFRLTEEQQAIPLIFPQLVDICKLMETPAFYDWFYTSFVTSGIVNLSVSDTGGISPLLLNLNDREEDKTKSLSTAMAIKQLLILNPQKYQLTVDDLFILFTLDIECVSLAAVQDFISFWKSVPIDWVLALVREQKEKG